MGLSSLTIDDFGWGINNVDPPSKLRPGEALACVNVIPTSGGRGLRTRPGLASYNTVLPAATRVQSLYGWALKQLIIAAQDNDVFSASTIAGSAWTKRFDSASANHHPWVFEIAKDGANVEKLWMVNGIDVPQKWDGAAATTSAWINPPPAGCTWIKLWKNRMVAGGNPAAPDRVYYSNIGNPELPAVSWNFIDIRSSYDDSDVLTWAELVGDNLLVFKRNSTWLVYDSNTFANRRLGYPGCPHENLSCVLDGKVYFISKDGLWVTDGITDPVHIPTKDVNAIMLPLDALAHGSWLIDDPAEKRLVYIRATADFTTGVMTDSQTYFYYPPGVPDNPHKEGTWWRQLFVAPVPSAVAKMYLLTDGVGHGSPIRERDYQLVWGSLGGDLTLLSDTTFTDWSSSGFTDNISVSWTSGYLELTKSAEKIERVRRLNLIMEVLGAGNGPNVSLSSDFTGVSSHTVLSTELDSTGYLRLRPETRGRTHHVSLSHVSSTAAFVLHEMELEFRGGKEHVQR